MAAAVLLAAGLARAQAPAKDAAPFKYEVASIKPGVAGEQGMAHPMPGGQRYKGTNLPLKLYIASEYQLKPDQILGAKGWAETEGFDIEARAEKPATLDEHHLMMRSLLADRFHLQFHFETKEMPIYALVVEEGGAKLKPHDAANSGEPWIEQESVAPFHPKWTATATPMELFAFRLGLILDRPVIDQTGLKGEYDFILTYTKELPPNIPSTALLNGEPIDISGPTIFEAMRQQLGLRLIARKGQAQILVIDHAEPPTEN